MIPSLTLRYKRIVLKKLDKYWLVLKIQKSITIATFKLTIIEFIESGFIKLKLLYSQIIYISRPTIRVRLQKVTIIKQIDAIIIT